MRFEAFDLSELVLERRPGGAARPLRAPVTRSTCRCPARRSRSPPTPTASGRWSTTCSPMPSSSRPTAAGSRSASPRPTAWRSCHRGLRDRHLRGRPRTAVRAVLPRRERHRAGDPGHRPRPCHLEGHRRGARRRARGRAASSAYGSTFTVLLRDRGARDAAPGRLIPPERSTAGIVRRRGGVAQDHRSARGARGGAGVVRGGRRLHRRRRGGVRDPRPLRRST